MGLVNLEDVFQVVEAILDTLEVVIQMEAVILDTTADVIPAPLGVVTLVEDHPVEAFQVEVRQDHHMALQVPLACLTILWENGMRRETVALPKRQM